MSFNEFWRGKPNRPFGSRPTGSWNPGRGNHNNFVTNARGRGGFDPSFHYGPRRGFTPRGRYGQNFNPMYQNDNNRWPFQRNQQNYPDDYDSTQSFQNKPFLSPPRRSPPRIPSPLPGSEEYMQRDISEKSALLKRELELEGGDSFSDSTPYVSKVNSETNEDEDVESSAEAVPTPAHVKTKKPSKPVSVQSTLSVEEIHKKLINHISNLSYNKKYNIVNQSGPSGYDYAIQQLTRQKRSELSRVLRDMCSNEFKKIDESSEVINAIIPDFDIKLEMLPLDVVQQLSSTLNEDVGECVQLSSIDPELLFQQAADMLTGCESFDPAPSSPAVATNENTQSSVTSETSNEPQVMPSQPAPYDANQMMYCNVPMMSNFSVPQFNPYIPHPSYSNNWMMSSNVSMYENTLPAAPIVQPVVPEATAANPVVETSINVIQSIDKSEEAVTATVNLPEDIPLPDVPMDNKSNEVEDEVPLATNDEIIEPSTLNVDSSANIAPNEDVTKSPNNSLKCELKPTEKLEQSLDTSESSITSEATSTDKESEVAKSPDLKTEPIQSPDDNIQPESKKNAVDVQVVKDNLKLKLKKMKKDKQEELKEQKDSSTKHKTSVSKENTKNVSKKHSNESTKKTKTKKKVDEFESLSDRSRSLSLEGNKKHERVVEESHSRSRNDESDVVHKTKHDEKHSRHRSERSRYEQFPVEKYDDPYKSYHMVEDDKHRQSYDKYREHVYSPEVEHSSDVHWYSKYGEREEGRHCKRHYYEKDVYSQRSSKYPEYQDEEAYHRHEIDYKPEEYEEPVHSHHHRSKHSRSHKKSNKKHKKHYQAPVSNNSNTSESDDNTSHSRTSKQRSPEVEDRTVIKHKKTLKERIQMLNEFKSFEPQEPLIAKVKVEPISPVKPKVQSELLYSGKEKQVPTSNKVKKAERTSNSTVEVPFTNKPNPNSTHEKLPSPVVPFTNTPNPETELKTGSSLKKVTVQHKIAHSIPFTNKPNPETEVLHQHKGGSMTSNPETEVILQHKHETSVPFTNKPNPNPANVHAIPFTNKPNPESEFVAHKDFTSKPSNVTEHYKNISTVPVTTKPNLDCYNKTSTPLVPFTNQPNPEVNPDQAVLNKSNSEETNGLYLKVAAEGVSSNDAVDQSLDDSSTSHTEDNLPNINSITKIISNLTDFVTDTDTESTLDKSDGPKKALQRPWKSPGEKKFMMEQLNSSQSQSINESDLSLDEKIESQIFINPQCETHAIVAICEPEVIRNDNESPQKVDILHSAEVSSTSDTSGRNKTLPTQDTPKTNAVTFMHPKLPVAEEVMLITTYTQTEESVMLKRDEKTHSHSREPEAKADNNRHSHGRQTTEDVAAKDSHKSRSHSRQTDEAAAVKDDYKSRSHSRQTDEIAAAKDEYKSPSQSRQADIAVAPKSDDKRHSGHTKDQKDDKRSSHSKKKHRLYNIGIQVSAIQNSSSTQTNTVKHKNAAIQSSESRTTTTIHIQTEPISITEKNDEIPRKIVTGKRRSTITKMIEIDNQINQLMQLRQSLYKELDCNFESDEEYVEKEANSKKRTRKTANSSNKLQKVTSRKSAKRNTSDDESEVEQVSKSHQPKLRTIEEEEFVEKQPETPAALKSSRGESPVSEWNSKENVRTRKTANSSNKLQKVTSRKSGKHNTSDDESEVEQVPKSHKAKNSTIEGEEFVEKQPESPALKSRRGKSPVSESNSKENVRTRKTAKSSTKLQKVTLRKSIKHNTSDDESEVEEVPKSHRTTEEKEFVEKQPESPATLKSSRGNSPVSECNSKEHVVLEHNATKEVVESEKASAEFSELDIDKQVSDVEAVPENRKRKRGKKTTKKKSKPAPKIQQVPATLDKGDTLNDIPQKVKTPEPTTAVFQTKASLKEIDTPETLTVTQKNKRGRSKKSVSNKRETIPRRSSTRVSRNNSESTTQDENDIVIKPSIKRIKHDSESDDDVPLTKLGGPTKASGNNEDINQITDVQNDEVQSIANETRDDPPDDSTQMEDMAPQNTLDETPKSPSTLSTELVEENLHEPSNKTGEHDSDRENQTVCKSPNLEPDVTTSLPTDIAVDNLDRPYNTSEHDSESETIIKRKKQKKPKSPDKKMEIVPKSPSPLPTGGAEEADNSFETNENNLETFGKHKKLKKQKSGPRSKFQAKQLILEEQKPFRIPSFIKIARYTISQLEDMRYNLIAKSDKVGTDDAEEVDAVYDQPESPKVDINEEIDSSTKEHVNSENEVDDSGGDISRTIDPDQDNSNGGSDDLEGRNNEHTQSEELKSHNNEDTQVLTEKIEEDFKSDNQRNEATGDQEDEDSKLDELSEGDCIKPNECEAGVVVTESLKPIDVEDSEFIVPTESHAQNVAVLGESEKCEESSSNSQEISNEFAMEFKGFTGAILAIKVLNETVLAASDHGQLLYFNMTTGDISHTFSISKVAITSMLVINRNGIDYVYVGSLNTNLTVINFNAREVCKEERIGEPIQCLEHAWDYIFVGSGRGSLMRFDLNTEGVEEVIKISDANVLAIKATTEGPRRVLVIATRSSAVCVRDAYSGLLLRSMEAPFFPTVYTLLLHKNLVYCGTSQHDILVFTFGDGQLVHKHEATKSKGVVCMQILGNLLFAGCYNGNIYVYNTNTKTLLGTMKGPGGLMLSMEIVLNKIIIVGTKSNNFKSWQIPWQYLNEM